MFQLIVETNVNASNESGIKNIFENHIVNS
jgi:hypothetical protein